MYSDAAGKAREMIFDELKERLEEESLSEDARKDLIDRATDLFEDKINYVDKQWVKFMMQVKSDSRAGQDALQAQT